MNAMLFMAVTFGMQGEVRELEPLAGGHYRWYEHSATPLVLDARHLVAFGTAGAAVELETLANRGLTELARINAARADLIGGVVPRGLRTEAGVEQLAARIAADGVFVSPVFVDSLGGPAYFGPDVIVGFEDGVNTSDAEASIARAGAFEVRERDWTGMRGVWLLRSTNLDGFAVLRAANELAETPGVRFADVDWSTSASPDFVPPDPLFGMSWAHDNTGQTSGTAGVDMNAPEAWNITTGAGVIVMVMDDGVEFTHPDINVGWAQDFTGSGGGGAPVHMYDNHGTAVAGCVAGRMGGTPAIGNVGIAPSSSVAAAKIAYYSDFWGAWEVQQSYLVNALWAAQQINVGVTNLSWSLGSTMAGLDAKYQETYATMVHFAASGNGSVGTIAYPARAPYVNAVGAIDHNGVRAEFAGGCLNAAGGSNWGNEQDFSAPGEDVITCDRTGVAGYTAAGDYICIDGTSFASPYAAGVAALVRSVNPTLTPSEVELALVLSVRDFAPAGWDSAYGHGAVDAYAAALRAQNFPSTTYCTAGTSTNGCLATMASSGLPSATATSGFLLTTSNVEGQKPGLLFYGINGRHAVPWNGGNSFLCVKSPVQRTPAQNSGGFNGTCSGAHSLDWLAYVSANPNAIGQPLTPGTKVQAQLWYRDPTAPGTTNLSNGIEFPILP